MRKLKGLEPFISVSVVNPLMLENGWTLMTVFREQPEIRSINMNFCISFISTPIHTTADELLFPCCGQKEPHHRQQRISRIIRMFNTAFDALGAKAGDYYPPALQTKIDELNGWIYDTVNNGVYKAGFATSQQAYDEAVAKVFESLARLEQFRPASLPDRQPANRSRYSPVDYAGAF